LLCCYGSGMRFMRRHARDQGWANVIAALALAVALVTAGSVTWSSGQQFWGAIWYISAVLISLVGVWALLALLTDVPRPQEPQNRRHAVRALYRLREASLAFVGHGTRGGLLVSLDIPAGASSWQAHADQWSVLYSELIAARNEFDAEADVVGEWFARPAKLFSHACIADWETKLGHPNDSIRNRAIPEFFSAVDEMLGVLNHPPRMA
jgi:hypothetical protein